MLDAAWPPAEKDEQAHRPIAGAWRGALREVVRRFASGDYGLSTGVAGVSPVASATAEQIRKYVGDYRATLVELPDNSWGTSVAQWYGTHWELLVDLWTAEEGRSDLVLFCTVREAADGYVITLDSVHVP
jgi:hypothetical protein